MRKFYPVNKGRFSACLCKIYTVEVCMIFVENLSFFAVISCVRHIEKISVISHKTFFRKGQERQNKKIE